jgi:hypothetical protein
MKLNSELLHKHDDYEASKKLGCLAYILKQVFFQQFIETLDMQPE